MQIRMACSMFVGGTHGTICVQHGKSSKLDTKGKPRSMIHDEIAHPPSVQDQPLIDCLPDTLHLALGRYGNSPK